MRRAAHNGCCRRVALTKALFSALWKLLVSEELDQVLMSIEIPLVWLLTLSLLYGVFFQIIFFLLYIIINRSY